MGKFLYKTTLGSLRTKFPISSFLEVFFCSGLLHWFLNLIFDSKGFAGFFSLFGTLELFIWVSLDEVELDDAGILDIDCLVNVRFLLFFFTPIEDFLLAAKEKQGLLQHCFSLSFPLPNTAVISPILNTSSRAGSQAGEQAAGLCNLRLGQEGTRPSLPPVHQLHVYSISSSTFFKSSISPHRWSIIPAHPEDQQL